MPYVGDYKSRVVFRVDGSNIMDLCNDTISGPVDNSIGVISGNDPSLLSPTGTIDASMFQEVTFANGQTWRWEQQNGW
jgi:hypothetical protein